MSKYSQEASDACSRRVKGSSTFGGGEGSRRGRGRSAGSEDSQERHHSWLPCSKAGAWLVSFPPKSPHPPTCSHHYGTAKRAPTAHLQLEGVEESLQQLQRVLVLGGMKNTRAEITPRPVLFPPKPAPGHLLPSCSHHLSVVKRAPIAHLQLEGVQEALQQLQGVLVLGHVEHARRDDAAVVRVR